MSWTLDELVRRAAEALAAQGVRSSNGRVTPLPDRRTVRWYSTIGLVDRPVAYQGRTARYGLRHLLQVVAVKRRQAQGRSLAEIQAELAGATDRTLREAAQLSDSFGILGPAADCPESASGVVESVSGVVESAGGAVESAGGGPVSAGRLASRPSPQANPSRPRFWAAPPSSSGTAEEMEVSYAVSLHPGVQLMLRAQPDAADLTELRAAAQPLLDLLSQRGLLNEGD